MSSATSLWCLFITVGAIQNANAGFLRVYNKSLDNYFVTPLNKPLPILPLIDETKLIVFYTFGGNGKVNGPVTELMVSTYLSSGYNVILVDYEEEAKATTSLVLEFPLIVARAKKIAAEFGEALIQLSANGLPINTTYLTGFSLGAHVMGWAGETFQKSNETMPRITGLEPSIGVSGLKPSQAKCVEAVHTNPGVFGTPQSVGTVDFWANCGNLGVQPGCPLIEPNPEKSCSHNRVAKLYSEALKNSTAFRADFARNCKEWKSNRGSSTRFKYLGECVSQGEEGGNFYFCTNSQAPFPKAQC